MAASHDYEYEPSPAVLFTNYVAKRADLVQLIKKLEHTEFKEAVQADLDKFIPRKQKKPARILVSDGVVKKKKKQAQAKKA